MLSHYPTHHCDGEAEKANSQIFPESDDNTSQVDSDSSVSSSSCGNSDHDSHVPKEVLQVKERKIPSPTRHVLTVAEQKCCSLDERVEKSR